MKLNAKQLGITAGVAAAGVLCVRRWRHNRRRTGAGDRFRMAAIGAAMVLAAGMMRWKAVRALSRTVGMTLIGRSVYGGRGKHRSAGFLTAG